MKNLCLFLSMDTELVSDTWLIYPLKKEVRAFRTFPRSELISGIKKAPAVSDRGS